MKLSKSDYKKILDYYNIKYTDKTSFKSIKRKAENILSDKLCRCIKKVQTRQKKSLQTSIGICKKSVLKNKKLQCGKFTCKKKPRFIKDKKTKITLKKI